MHAGGSVSRRVRPASGDEEGLAASVAGRPQGTPACRTHNCAATRCKYRPCDQPSGPRIAGARRRGGIAPFTPPARDAAHDCFDHAELADPTIGMATKHNRDPLFLFRHCGHTPNSSA
jgi:hypothetical protein